MHPQKHHSTGTLNHCSCLTIKDFAVQAEMVAVETFLDVGNILWMFYDCHCPIFFNISQEGNFIHFYFLFFSSDKAKNACRDLLTVKYTECGLREQSLFTAGGAVEIENRMHTICPPPTLETRLPHFAPLLEYCALNVCALKSPLLKPCAEICLPSQFPCTQIFTPPYLPPVISNACSKTYTPWVSRNSCARWVPGSCSHTNKC